MQDRNNQNNQKSFLSSLTAKIILTLIIFVGSAIIIISGTKFIIENYKIPINKIIKSQCEIDSDCQMVYVGFGPCPPCDYLSKEYQCLNESEKIKIWNERIERDKSKPVTACSPCAIEPDRYICECKNGKCEKIKEQIVEEIIITTDKIEYQKGEEVKLTVENNLDEDIEFYNTSVEKFNNGEWGEVRFNVEYPCLSLCEKFPTILSPNDSEEFIWNQRGDACEEMEKGRYRFKIYWNIHQPATTSMAMRDQITYSNEFIIKGIFFNVEGLNNCQEDSDCKVDFSHCDCQYHCVNRNIEMTDCAVDCDETGPIISECVCQNNKCVDKNKQTNISTFKEVIIANNQFALDLYSEYKSEQGNIFFSPYSISTVLAMTYEGARGKTAEEMQSVFYFPKDNSKRRNGYLNLYNQINKKDKEYQLFTANALWAQKDYKFLDEYFNIVEKYYNGKVTNLDFGKENKKSTITINNWVEDKTNNKITNLIPQGVLSPPTRLVLTNAIYFKGNWVKQFNEKYTHERDFTTDSGNTVKVQMMERADDKAKFNYVKINEIQILEMPYDGDDLSMLVILPKEDDLFKIEKSINLEKLSEWKNQMKEQRVNIYIPKFKFETKYFMADTLKEMGMPTAFSMNADFSGMTGIRDLFIEQVIHQAFVEVNEEGTEAAAATAVVISQSAVLTIPTFFANHPFIFIIQEKETGNILFMGRVGNPNK